MAGKCKGYTNGGWTVRGACGQDTHSAAIEPGNLHFGLQAVCRMAGRPQPLQISVAVEDEQYPHVRILLQALQASCRNVWSAAHRQVLSGQGTCNLLLDTCHHMPDNQPHLLECHLNPADFLVLTLPCSLLKLTEACVDFTPHFLQRGVEEYRKTSFARALRASNGWRGVPFLCEKQDCRWPMGARGYAASGAAPLAGVDSSSLSFFCRT